MIASLFLTALLSPSAPVVKPSKPLGLPPRIVSVAAAGDGRVTVIVTEPRTVVQKYTYETTENGAKVTKVGTREVTVTETKRVGLAEAGATFRTAGDKALTPAEAATRLREGGFLIVPAERNPIDPAYLSILAPETIVASYAKDGKVSFVSAAASSEPSIIAVTADPKGNPLIPARGTREVTVKVPITKEVDGVAKIDYLESKQTVEDLVPTPFDDVKPETLTAGGKPVEPADARKRLTAGTIVLVSTDGRPVSELYRKLVKPDTLMLHAAKMVHPARQPLPSGPIRAATIEAPVAPPPPPRK